MKYTSNDLNLLKYAIDNGAATYVDAGASFETSYANKGYLNLRYDDDGTEKLVTVNFGSDMPSNAEAEFLRVIRLNLPVVEILDLVSIALEKSLIRDESGRAGLAEYSSFDNDYKRITLHDGYFVFSVMDDSGIRSVYNVTFNNAARFPRRLHVEYAGRSSMFVKAILDKVMYKYNILIVAKASMSGETVPSLPIAGEFELRGNGETENSDDVIENEIHGQIKVLISYRDTVNNDSYSERVIDDIYVDNADAAEPEFNVSNIHPSDEAGGSAAPLRNIPDGELQAISAIHALFDRDDIKFKIFETLRASKTTALSRLIDRRFRNYKKSEDGDIPKVDFTLTPIAIYSNHIVRTIKKYKIAYKNPPERLRGLVLEYQKIIEPNSSLYHEITVDEDGDPIVLSDALPLAVALCNNYIDAEPMAVLLPCGPEYVVRLDENNPDYYGELFRGVYFDKRALVLGADTGYAGTKYDGKYFLREDLQVCAASHKLYHKSELVGVDGGIIEANGILNTAYAGSLVYKKLVSECPMCGTKYGAAQESYRAAYFDKNLLDDGSGTYKHCCDMCVGTVSGGRAIFRDNSADNAFYTDVYSADGAAQRTALCPCCLGENEGGDAAKMTVNVKPAAGAPSTVCKICGKTVCKEHFEFSLGVCKACKAPGEGSKSFVKPHVLWKPLRRCLRLADKLCKDVSIDDRPRLGEVRLFLNKASGTVVYYIYRDSSGKHAFAVKKVTKL